MTIGQLVKDNVCTFSFYRAGFMYYTVPFENKNYRFSIPMDDVGNGTFDKEMKAITLMRWIKKALEGNELIVV